MNADSDNSNRKERGPHRPSRVWRTLLGAAIGALLAMSMVPYVTRGRAGDHGYLPIYEIGGRADVNVAQLVLNVSFAALAGALAANLPRRAVYLIAACLGVAAIATGIVAVVQQSAVARAYSDERYADQLLRFAFARFQSPLQQEDVKKAKLYLLHAAENWHIAGNAAEEQRVRAKEKNTIDLSGLPDQLQKRTLDFVPDPYPAGKTKNPFDQFDTAKAYRVTGLVLEVNDRMIAFQRGTDRWEVARASNTKVTGDLKVGATVTITYTMDAAEVAVKDIFDRLSPSDFPNQPQKPR